MCCFAMSASVEWVAMRTDAAPAAWAASRSSTVPMPGSSSTVTRARVTLADCGLDPFAIGVRAEAVVEARAREPVTVADLDGIDTSAIERRGNAPHVGDGILVANGVHAVAERDVLDVEAAAHAITGRAAEDAASRSPVRSAADVMMSRLPAYFGR